MNFDLLRNQNNQFYKTIKMQAQNQNEVQTGTLDGYTLSKTLG